MTPDDYRSYPTRAPIDVPDAVLQQGGSPAWAGGSTRRRQVRISESATRYYYGSFYVDVADEGYILVNEDDWLSKYSLAIHNDLQVDGRYMRLVTAQPVTLAPIENRDVVYKGEVLVHMDTYRKSQQAKQAAEATEEVAVREPDTQPKSPSISIMQHARRIVEELIPNVVALSFKYAGNAGAAGLVGVAGVALLIRRMLLDLEKALDFGTEIERHKAALYATTAWIYLDLTARRARSPKIKFPVPRTVADLDTWKKRLAPLGNVERELDARIAAWELVERRVFDKLWRDVQREALDRGEYSRRCRLHWEPGAANEPSKGRELTRKEFFTRLTRELLQNLESGGVAGLNYRNQLEKLPEPVRGPNSPFP